MTWYHGVNTGEDVQNVSPDAYRFHGTYKSLVRMILPRLKTPQSWLDQMDGNAAVLRDIYYEYLEHEQQTVRPNEKDLRATQDRKTVMTSIIPFMLSIVHYDPNYREVFNWFLFRICQEYDAGKIYHNPYCCIPSAWYADEKGRSSPRTDTVLEFISEHNKKFNDRLKKEQSISSKIRSFFSGR